MIPGNGEESPEAFAADPMLILKHQHGIYGYEFLGICCVYLDRG